MIKRLCIFMIVFVAIAVGCSKKKAGKEKIFPVKTVRLARGPVTTSVTVMGSVDSRIHAWILAPAEGTVTSLGVREGDHVGEGRMLFYIMPPEYQSMLGQARIEYQAAKRAFQSAGGPDRDTAAAALAEAKARYDSAKKLFRLVPVVSTSGGTVISKSIENGSNVTLKQPLVEIADMSRLIVKTAVSEDVAPRLRRGQKAKIKLYTDSEKSLMGVITMITPGVNYRTRTAGIELSVPRNNTLRPGMTCAVEFVTNARSDAISVPIESVITDIKGRKMVFTAVKGRAKATFIKTGIESNTMIEVLSGLMEGDEVVVMGHENLKDGVKVKISGAGQKKEKAVKAGEKK